MLQSESILEEQKERKKSSAEGETLFPWAWARNRKVMNSLSNWAELIDFPLTFATKVGTGLPFSLKESGPALTIAGSIKKIKSSDLNFIVG